jgi:hypothetical protein
MPGSVSETSMNRIFSLSTSVHTAMTIALATPALVLAAGGDSGTGAVGEMEVSGSQLLMIFGGVIAVGVAIWLVIKLMNK